MLLRIFCLLAAVLALASPAAAAEWREAKSKHFIIYSDGSLEQLREFATKVEKFDRAVRIARKMADPPLGDHGRLTIYVLKEQGAVARMYGDARSMVAGFYLPRASGSIAFVHRETTSGIPSEWREFMLSADAVFFHEYFHHMMLSEANAAIPRWVVEGFAEFFSTATIEKDGSVMFGRAANHRSSGLFSISDVSLEEILGDSFGKLRDDGINELYAHSWLLTHYLFSATNRKGQLEKYLAGIQAGKPAIVSAREAFGDLKLLDRELEKYLMGSSLTAFVLPASQVSIDPIQVRTMNAAETEIMPIRMRSDRGVDAKAAAEVVKQARIVGAKYPNDPFVQGALAEAEQDVGDFAAAIAAADRALAVNPDDVQALIYKGRALMAQGRADPKKADWRKVRILFAHANRLEPEYSEPLMLYYQTYQVEGVQPPESAVAGLLYAVLLAPGDPGLRMSAVVELIQRNRLAEAKTAFVPIAYDPHQGAEWRDRNAKIMEAIAAGKGDEAMTLIQAPPPQSAKGKGKS